MARRKVARKVERSDEYCLPTSPEKHSSISMAIAWGRLAARLGWNLGEDLHDEVIPELHAIASMAYLEALCRQSHFLKGNQRNCPTGNSARINQANQGASDRAINLL